MDRLDYVSMMCNEHAYVLAIERLLGIVPPERAQYIRVMFDEITRILNHLMWLGSHGLDIGAMTVFLLCFKEREELMDVYEAVSGTRMHATYYRPGGVYRDLPDAMPKYQASRWRSQSEVDRLNESRSGSMLDFIEAFARRFPKVHRRLRNAAHRQPHLEAAHGEHRRGLAGARDAARLLRADAARLRHRVGSAQEAALRSLRPHGLRHSGRRERRLLRPLSGAHRGDAPVRTASSCSASSGCAPIPGPVMVDNRKVRAPSREEMKEDMEALIHHFKFFTEGYCVPAGETYAAIEAPKGELGVYLVSDGANKPYRFKVRAPGLCASRLAG